MPHVLHLLKGQVTDTALSAIGQQCRESETAVTLILLHGVPAPALPDTVIVRRLLEEGHQGDLTYSELLDLIFSADSVISW
ncbi:MAG: hypothetical protein ACE5JD_01160 [Candidatus Methylomirabilia bacterium]